MSQAAPAWRVRPVRRYRWAGTALIFLAAAIAPRVQGADAMISGITYRPVTDVAGQYGMKTSWVTPGKTMQLQNEYCTIGFTLSERILRINDEPVALGYPIVQKQGVFYLAKSDFEKNIFPLLSPGQIASPVPALHRIVIDPGHGGKDSGTEVFPPGTHLPPAANAKDIDNEKTHTLEVGLLLAAELKKRGYEVILTRTSDVAVDLAERPDIANKANADLFISVHFNHADQDYVSGTEVNILTPFGQLSTAQSNPAELDKRILAGNKFDDWNIMAGFSRGARGHARPGVQQPGRQARARCRPQRPEPAGLAGGLRVSEQPRGARKDRHRRIPAENRRRHCRRGGFVQDHAGPGPDQAAARADGAGGVGGQTGGLGNGVGDDRCDGK